MTRPAEVTETPPTRDEAYTRMAKAILRHKAVNQLVRAIKADLVTLPKTGVMAKRSVKVLDYMRGYIAAVEEEISLAVEAYEETVFQERQALVEPPKKERKSTLGRVRRDLPA